MKEFLKELNNFALSCADKEKEVVDDKRALECLYIVTNIEINTLEDVALFCIANNLLNAYVKQQDSLVGYYFKKSIFVLIRALETKEIKDLKMSYQKDNSMSLLIISLCDSIQFSFHGVSINIKNLIKEEYKADLVWDEVRKQKCAVSLFNKVMDYLKDDEKIATMMKEAENISEQFVTGKLESDSFKKVCKLPEYCYEYDRFKYGEDNKPDWMTLNFIHKNNNDEKNIIIDADYKITKEDILNAKNRVDYFYAKSNHQGSIRELSNYLKGNPIFAGINFYAVTEKEQTKENKKGLYVSIPILKFEVFSVYHRVVVDTIISEINSMYDSCMLKDENSDGEIDVQNTKK